MSPIAIHRTPLFPRLLLLLIWVALALRLLRLDWQPLWWDEGYSLYFATEPLARMVDLTARDIHPPLYYALLHGWFMLLADSGPVTARLFSVGCGVLAIPALAWLARMLYPARPTVALVAAALLTLSPMHLFYSQEVRMYAAVLPVTLLSTALFYRLIMQYDRARFPWRVWLLYVACAALALQLLYYAGLLLLAHQVWALWVGRHTPKRLWVPLAAGATVLLLQAPWLLYTLPRLVPYIADKVIADQDMPLALWAYAWRHAVAFSAGHLPLPTGGWDAVRQLTPLLLAAVLIVGLRRNPHRAAPRSARQALAFWIMVPMLSGFLINLRLPFFPSGGERLLLPALPYVYLLIADALTSLRTHRLRLVAATAGILLPSVLGLLVFFTLPRHVEHDYRPIVRFITQHGRDQDSILALFPWQVGYWRAYSPRTAQGERYAPQPPALDQEALTWTPALQAQIDAALQQGTLWFPAPLSFGSTLPGAIESYLEQVARPLENRWFSPATRVSAWIARGHDDSPPRSITADYGDVILHAARVTPHTTVAANSPVRVDLYWHGATPRADWRVTLRLTDAAGHVWAQRDLATLAAQTSPTAYGAREELALQVPAGLPPGSYQVIIGLADAAAQALFPREATSPWTVLADIQIILPDPPAPPARAAFDHRLTPPADHPVGRLLGTGPHPTGPLLAGTELMLDLVWQTDAPLAMLPDLSFSLSAPSGARVELTVRYPAAAPPTTALWPPATLLRLPVALYLPPDLASGGYTLQIGSPAWSVTYPLGQVNVQRRAQRLTPILPAHTLDTPVQFGTHVELVGYDWTRHGNSLHLELTWHVRQTLLPPHAIFVHAIDADGTHLAQEDAPPVTQDGPAPTGSWLPGEWLTTRHTLVLPAHTPLPHALLVGLYNPADQVRLPAAIGAVTIGDAARLPLD